MKKRKVILAAAVVCAAVMLFVSFGVTLSFLLDQENATNVVSIGNVQLEVSEGNFTTSTVAAGGTVDKAPQIKNTGSEDEYVFFAVAVPKENVTLLYEEETTVGEENNQVTYPEGTPTVNNRNDDGTPKKVSDEIFRMIAEGDNIANVTETDPPNDKPQLDFMYHKGDSTEEGDGHSNTNGWVYLTRELNQTFNNDNDKKYDIYYFGYNRRIKPDGSTLTLFDKVQLKSFIDEEVSGKNNKDELIKVTAYGIQADSLGGDLTTIGAEAYLTKTQLTKIWGIVNRKQG